MKLKCILTATNEKPLYIDFLPIFCSSWKKLYPDVDVKIIFVGDTLPAKFEPYNDHIIHFPPIQGVSSAFVSQYIRLIYPALLSCDGGVMITDIDMLPMSPTYYSDNIKEFSCSDFIYLRDIKPAKNEIAMCYNVAHPTTWADIFHIKSYVDVRNRLKSIHDSIQYDNKPGGKGWVTDQVHLWSSLRKWSGFKTRFRMLCDTKTKFKRLCRLMFYTGQIKTVQSIENQIKNGIFTDYHALRPHKKFKNINEMIVRLLPHVENRQNKSHNNCKCSITHVCSCPGHK